MNDSNKKILSISIAAYNVDKYLEKALSSLVFDGELFDNLEVIIVNDGSKDKTIDIANKYVNKYPNVFRLIDKKNAGYGSTINESLKIATGKYYKLLDGDDWFNTDGLIKILELLKNTNSDLVVTKYYKFNETNGKYIAIDHKLIYDGIEKSFDLFKPDEAIPMHAIIYKTKILVDNKLNITEHCYYTDLEYILKPIVFVNTFICYDIFVYVYRIGNNEQSVSLSSWKKNIDMATKVSIGLVDYYNEHINNIKDEYKKNYIFNRISYSIEGKYKNFLSFMFDNKAKNKLINFDKIIKNKSNEFYHKTYEKKYVSLLRKSNFLLYYPMSLIYNIFLIFNKQ